MTPALAAQAKRLVEAEAGDASSAAHVAGAAVRACEKLTTHVARLLGHAGIRTLLDRALALTRKSFPWIASIGPGTGESRWAPLHASLLGTDPATGLAAFSMFIATFVELFGRLIGEPLVVRLLHEIWPEIFIGASKEST